MRRPKSCQRITNRRRRFVLARAAEKKDDDDDASSSSSKLAPSTPTSAHGEMLEYILSTEPDSFEGAMDIKKIDRRRAVEDAMYASIIHKVIIVSFFFFFFFFFFFGNARYSSRADNAT